MPRRLYRCATLTPSPQRRVGSSFELAKESMRATGVTPPWLKGSTDSFYVQTGRQALALCADYFSRHEGRDLLVAPTFACSSMLEPFRNAGWRMRFFSHDPALAPNGQVLRSLVRDPKRSVVLTMAYFGAHPSSEHVADLGRLRREGVRVIDDETHRVLTASAPSIADISIASLRKTLPVPDGAYIRGSLSVNILGGASLDEPSPHDGWAAMKAKTNGDSVGAREMSARSEAALSRSRPCKASLSTLTELCELNYSAMSERRAQNARFLRSLLAGTCLPVIEAEVPSHLVIRVEDPSEAQASLARRGIFCPIHWPKPPEVDESMFPDDLLSLPVDHRYGEDDMLAVAAAVHEVIAR